MTVNGWHSVGSTREGGVTPKDGTRIIDPFILIKLDESGSLFLMIHPVHSSSYLSLIFLYSSSSFVPGRCLKGFWPIFDTSIPAG